jgi:hypothetical protein
METRDTTLIIHGPISMHTAFMMYRYADTFPIVVVSPKPEQLSRNNILTEIKSLMERKGNGISLFLYDASAIDTKKIDNSQNKYYHFYSVYLGLQACRTPSVLKLRSDEFYSDISPLIDAIHTHNNKLITTDVFFRNCSMPWHPSDHIVGGSTSIMTDTFKLAKEMCEGFESIQSKQLIKHIKDVTGKDFIAAEQFLGMAGILSQASANKLKEPKCEELMKELFHIVPTEQLGMFRVMFNSASPKPIEYTDTKYYNEAIDVDDINNYTCK